MGEAANRGTFEERREQSLEQSLDTAEVLVMFSEVGGGINMSVLHRDEEPNQESIAVVMANFIHANLPAICKAAALAKMQHDRPADKVTIEQRQPLSILGVDGNVLRSGDGADLRGIVGEKL